MAIEKTTDQTRVVRIINCLETILDLEPELAKLEVGLREEFAFLKSFLEKIDRVDLSEADVARIEQATSNFLEELRLPLGRVGMISRGPRRLQ